MHRVHEAFPLIVYQGMVESQDKIKIYLEELRDYWFDGYENESPEYSGRIFAHQNKIYRPFLKNFGLM